MFANKAGIHLDVSDVPNWQVAASRPSRKLWALILLGALSLAMIARDNVLHASTTQIESANQFLAIDAGAKTRGGAREQATIQIVRNLADSGEGSLRAALEADGPRIVVFEVAGAISLASDLRIEKPYITIAGQTAPSPGITIQGAKLSVQTHNVVIQHMAFRPGPALDEETNQNRDALSIGSCEACRQPTQDVRIENVSASWAVDEAIGIWGHTLDRVTIRNSVISEALREAGHPKGAHSMGMLVGASVQGVSVVGNLFASNMRRNPVISSGSSVIVANNFIYNAGVAAIHFYPGPLIRASIIGNVVRRGPSSRSNLRAVQAPRNFRKLSADSLIYAKDNQCCKLKSRTKRIYASSISLNSYAPVLTSAWQIFPSSQVWNWVKRFAGSRPADRDSVDQRIVKEVETNSGKVINQTHEVGGPPDIEASMRKLLLPSRPFAVLKSATGLRRIEAWLCKKHFEVGGPQTPECSHDAGFYQELLKQ